MGIFQRFREATAWVRDESWKTIETEDDLRAELEQRYGMGRRDQRLVDALVEAWWVAQANPEVWDWKKARFQSTLEESQRAAEAEQDQINREHERAMRERSRALDAAEATRRAETAEIAARDAAEAATHEAVRQGRLRAVREGRALQAQVAAVAWERAWQERDALSHGSYTVSLIGGATVTTDLVHFLALLPPLRSHDNQSLEALVERALHIAPEVVAENVDQHDAVAIKTAIEARGGRAKISSRAAPSDGTAKQVRRSIPERVRSEVWRRDGGVCVQCGSRERLEFHHIIPVSRGGADTTRNLELLCEKCHRPKGNAI